jgi:hypothetical protein
MPKKTGKKATFSKTKAVKANARDRVGQPAPTRTLPAQRPAQQGRRAKYKPDWSALPPEEM